MAEAKVHIVVNRTSPAKAIPHQSAQLRSTTSGREVGGQSTKPGRNAKPAQIQDNLVPTQDTML
jgi:hypothetical protein